MVIGSNIETFVFVSANGVNIETKSLCQNVLVSI